MPVPVIDQLRAERDQARDAAIAMAEGPEFDPSADAFTRLETRAQELDNQIERLVGIMEQRASAEALDARLGRLGQQRRDAGGPSRTTEASIGELFVRSPVFSEYPFRGTSQRFETAFEPQFRAPLMLGDLPASLRTSQRAVPDIAAPQRFLANATIVPVSTNGIETITWELTNNAAAVAEGAAKPESTLTPTVTPLSLKNIAHWTQFTRQLAEDATAVRSRIDNEMQRGVEQKMDADALATFLAGTYEGADYEATESVLAGIRRGVAVVQENGYVPNVVLLNANDWADFDLDILAATGSPSVGQQFWQLTPLAFSAIPAGTAYVADLRAAFEYYRRSTVSLYLTDSHASTFTSNILTLLAEARGVGAVVRPDAVSKVEAAVVGP